VRAERSQPLATRLEAELLVLAKFHSPEPENSLHELQVSTFQATGQRLAVVLVSENFFHEQI
jgi:hypothetical protein